MHMHSTVFIIQTATYLLHRLCHAISTTCSGNHEQWTGPLYSHHCVITRWNIVKDISTLMSWRNSLCFLRVIVPNKLLFTSLCPITILCPNVLFSSGKYVCWHYNRWNAILCFSSVVECSWGRHLSQNIYRISSNKRRGGYGVYKFPPDSFRV